MKVPALNELLVYFGGRFDPPHQGHEAVFRELSPQCKALKALPSGYAAYKPAIASPQNRLEMAQLAFGKSHVDSREIERTLTSFQPTYSVDTLLELKRELTGAETAFVIGSDQLESFTTWKSYRELLGLCHWIVLRRKIQAEPLKVLSDFEASGLARKEGGSWTLLGGKTTLQIRETEAQACSSTELREEMARTGNLPKNGLSPAVGSYLKEKKLYGIL